MPSTKFKPNHSKQYSMPGVYESNDFTMQDRQSANSSLKLTNSTIGKAGEQILGTSNHHTQKIRNNPP